MPKANCHQYHSQKKTLLCLLLPLFLASCIHRPASDSDANQGADRPPNIIYILADDLGYGDLGCYGQKILATPNIDLMARDGMRFTQHYAGSTVCAPSRASLLTGKHAGHINVKGNAPPGQLIREDELTVAEALHEVGYVSSVIGKWGVGHPPPSNDPQRNGFDHHYGYVNMWHAHNFYPVFLYRNAVREILPGNILDSSLNYRADMPEGTGVAKEKKTYVHGQFVGEALSFIEKNAGRSFFLYLALNMPHANNEAGYFLGDGMEVPMIEHAGQMIPDYGVYAKRDWPNPEKGFATMIKLIDQSVGMIDEKIQELGLSEETIIIFSSDNGPHYEGGHEVDFFDSNGPLRGAKRDLYEGGIRVPMIAKWPGHIESGTVSNHLCGFHDILPTFCEVTGAKTPEGIDGISFLSTLLGNYSDQKQHDFLYWEFYEQGGRQAARKNNFKYVKLNVRDPKKPVVRELFDLSNDLSEQNNIIDLHPHLVEEFEAILKSAHSPSPVISLFAKEEDAETAF